MRIALFWLLCLSMPLAGCSGCKSKGKGNGGPLTLTRPFRLNTTSQHMLMGAGLSAHKLTLDLERALRESKQIVLLGAKKSTKHAYRVEVAMGMRPIRPTGYKRRRTRRMRLLVSCQLSPTESGKASIVIEEHSIVQFVRRRPPSPSALRRKLQKLWQKLGYSIQVYAKLRLMPSASIRALLPDADGVTQRHAAHFLGKRKYAPAVSPLLKMMTSKDEQVLIAVVSALVKLKDQRAALPLIQSDRGKGFAYTRQIISALASIGGDVAHSYLFTLEAGHPNSDVRQTAKDALIDLKKRTK
jgi:hypothetical protein